QFRNKTDHCFNFNCPTNNTSFQSCSMGCVGLLPCGSARNRSEHLNRFGGHCCRTSTARIYQSRFCLFSLSLSLSQCSSTHYRLLLLLIMIIASVVVAASLVSVLSISFMI